MARFAVKVVRESLPDLVAQMTVLNWHSRAVEALDR